MRRIQQKVLIVTIIAVMTLCSFACKKRTPQEQEPNNSFNSANVLKINSLIRGFINNTADHDFYIVTARKSMVLDILVSPLKGINHAIRVWRFSDKPVLIKHIDDLRKSSPERFRNLSVEPGNYYIEILHGDKDIPKANLENEYILSVSGRDREMEETEPNDSPELAGPISFENVITGYYSPSFNKQNTNPDHQYREEDWFILTIADNTEMPVVLDAEISSVPGINAVLMLCDHNLQLIEQSDSNSASQAEQLKGIGLSHPGKYYIMVAAKNYESNNQTAYTLKINKRQYDSTFEMEPNNEFQKATVISENIISGRLSNTTDRDYYFIKNNSSSFYRISLNQSGTNNLYFTIYDNNKNLVQTVDNEITGVKEIAPNVYITGSFYLMVSLKGGIVQDELYQLEINKLEFDSTFEKEPNDTMEKANRIGKEIRGYISKKGDRDYFNMEFTERVKCRFKISGIDGALLRISITDPLGYVIKSREVKDERTIYLDEIIDGKGYVIIEGLSENYDNPYVVYVREGI